MKSLVVKPIFVAAIWGLAILTLSTDAQVKKMDLDDLTIKGELHGDDRLMIFSRQRNELKNFVKFRKSYRAEILQQLPEKSPKREF